MENNKKTATDIVKSYTRHLKPEHNYLPSTSIAYQNDLGWLLSFCEQQEVGPLDVRLEDSQHFMGQLHEDGIGPTSQTRILNGVCSFYRLLVLDGYIEQGPTELLEFPRLREHLPEVLSTEEVDMIENSVDLSKSGGRCNKVIIKVLFLCDLRVSELVNLQPSNLYLNEGFVRATGKGNKERLVPIPPKAVRELSLWSLGHSLVKIKPGEQDYALLNRRGAHLTCTTVLIMLKHQAQEAGIQKAISLYTLCHSFTTELLKGGANPRTIQVMLRHESIGTTEIYTHIDTTILREEVLLHHPRNAKDRPDEVSRPSTNDLESQQQAHADQNEHVDSYEF